jgi:hypothetical protein
MLTTSLRAFILAHPGSLPFIIALFRQVVCMTSYQSFDATVSSGECATLVAQELGLSESARRTASAVRSGSEVGMVPAD